MHSSEILYPVTLANPYRIFAIETSTPLDPLCPEKRVLEIQLATRLERERRVRRGLTASCKQAIDMSLLSFCSIEPINASKTLYLGLYYQPVQYSTDRI